MILIDQLSKCIFFTRWPYRPISLRLYMFHPILNSDSVLFMRLVVKLKHRSGLDMCTKLCIRHFTHSVIQIISYLPACSL